MRTRHALLALSLAAATSSADAQGPRASVDLSSHVNMRLRDAVHRLAECRARAPGVALPNQLALEATVRGRAIVVVSLDPSLPPAVRACVEETASRSAAPRRDMALTQHQSVRLVVPFLLQAGVQPAPTGAPTVVVQGQVGSSVVVGPELPRFTAGQSVSIEWNGGLYPAQVLAVESGGVRVHYVGWDAIWDEVVPFARVRLDAATTGPVIVPSMPGAPSGPAMPSAPVIVQPMPQPPVYVPPQPPQPPVYVPPQPPQPPVYVPPQPSYPQPPAYPQPVPGGRPNLVVNGSFEQPGLAPGTWNVFPTLPGWQTTAGGAVEVQNGVAGRSADGAHHVELDAHASASLAQDVQTQPGMTYELRLSFAARPGTGAQDNVLLVLWNGQPIARLVADGSNDPDTRWTTVTAWVTANGPRTRLELRDEGASNSMGTYVDDVRLTATR